MEAWFLGDLDAINQAFPRFKPEKYKNKSNFRIVDNINNPSKYLLKIIPEYTGRKVLPKLEVAKKIAPFLDIDKNNSSSFRNTIKAIRNLCDL